MKQLLNLLLISGVTFFTSCKTHQGDNFEGKWVVYQFNDGAGNTLKRSAINNNESMTQINRMDIEIKKFRDSAGQYIFNLMGNEIVMKKESETKIVGTLPILNAEYMPSNNHLILHMQEMTIDYERN